MLLTLKNVYTARAGDMVDAIVFKHYGRWGNDVMLPVLAANPWLLKLPLILEAGKLLVLPSVSTASVTPQVLTMWQDSPAATAPVAASLLVSKPASDYDGFATVDAYLAHYRSLQTKEDTSFVQLVQTSQPFYGSLTSEGAKVLRYSPQAGFVGTDRFLLSATNGTQTDTELIEIVVPAGGGIARYEMFAFAALVTTTASTLFCAVKATNLDAIQAFITSASNEVTQSHQPLGGANLATMSIELRKRLVSGGTVSLARSISLTNASRTGALIPIPSSLLNPGECLIANVTTVTGNVFGLSLDVYSSIP